MDRGPGVTPIDEIERRLRDLADNLEPAPGWQGRIWARIDAERKRAQRRRKLLIEAAAFVGALLIGAAFWYWLLT